jgi:hypothetical protein
MKTIRLLFMLALISGCATNGEFDQAKTWQLIGAVVVVGAVAVHNADSGKKDTLDPIIVRP